jgi:ATP-dependent protease Clp ATPase subunit
MQRICAFLSRKRVNQDCSFCGKKGAEVKRSILGDSELCDRCVYKSLEILLQESREELD